MSACSPKSSILTYGAFIEGNQTTFKIHAPQSTEVYLVIFEKPDKNQSKYKSKKCHKLPGN